MESYINNFLKVQDVIMKQFNCNKDYFIKPIISLKWSIKADENTMFLIYWCKEDKRVTLVVSRENGNPQIYMSTDYTMIIAIDCIKIAFILKNNNEI